MSEAIAYKLRPDVSTSQTEIGDVISGRGTGCIKATHWRNWLYPKITLTGDWRQSRGVKDDCAPCNAIGL